MALALAEGATGLCATASLMRASSLRSRCRSCHGDVLNHFMDKDGNLIQTEIEDRVISTDLDKLRQLKNVVGVAGGKDKVAATAVLNGGYLNVLITDSDTAAELLLS